MSTPGRPPAEPGAGLLALLGHDLRAIVTVVGGYSDLLSERGETLAADSRRAAHEAIRRGLRRAEVILDGLSCLPVNGPDAVGGAPGDDSTGACDAVVVLNGVLRSLPPGVPAPAVDVPAGPVLVEVAEDVVRPLLALVVQVALGAAGVGEAPPGQLHRHRGAARLRLGPGRSGHPVPERVELLLAAVLAGAHRGRAWTERGAVYVDLPLTAGVPGSAEPPGGRSAGG
jgi:hypothetical protein